MPRNKELNQKVKDERREQILSTALMLFAKKGLAATRITDISTETGISQGLIYHYYKSKEEIFTWLINSAMEKMNDAARNLEQLPVPAGEKIKYAVDELLKGIDKNESTARYYFLITQTALSEAVPYEAREIVRTQNKVKYEIMGRIFTAGQKEGTVRKYDVNEMVTCFFSSVNGLALNKAIYGTHFKMPDKNIFLSMFLQES